MTLLEKIYKTEQPKEEPKPSSAEEPVTDDKLKDVEPQETD
jgi:hypothetical protein